MSTTEIEVSSKITKLVEKFADAVTKLGDVQIDIHDLAKQIVEQSKEDGLSKAQLRELITDALGKKGCSERTIRRYLPATLKSSRGQELAGKGNSVKSKQMRTSLTAIVPEVNYQSEKPTEQLTIRQNDDQEQSSSPVIQGQLQSRLESAIKENIALQDHVTVLEAKVKNYQAIIRAVKALFGSYSETTSVRMSVLSAKFTEILEGNHL